jgi:hypothetical protein
MKNGLLQLTSLVLLIGLISACGVVVAPSTTMQNVPCEVSPRLPEHPMAAILRAPLGEYPVWFATLDTVAMSELDASDSPYSGGTVRKSLIVVSTEVEGDLVITGHQLDGDGIVLFPLQIDEERQSESGEQIIIYSEDDLSTQKLIPNAQITTNSPNAPGYAHHPWSAYYPAPGCYQLSASYGGHVTNIIVEIRNE